MTREFRFVPAGDRSVLVYLGEEIDPGINDQVLALARTLRANPHPAIVEVTHSYHALLIEYDPLRIRLDQVQEMVEQGLEVPAEPAAPRTVEIPVTYGGEMGPDLKQVAAHTGLEPESAVTRHTEPLYRVYCLGFSPGFPYLGGLDPALETPRLAEPRVKVPGGSVGIAGTQTGVYPSASPGGWQLIGRTPVQLFDPAANPPALLEPGDQVRFVAISPEEYERRLASSVSATPFRSAQGGDGSTGIRVLQPGMATTLQDLGRRGYMQFGVPVGGAADFWSLMVGNWLLGNRARTSALEITLTGPELEFTGPVAFALTGAPIAAELLPAGGGSPLQLPGWTAFLAGPGDRLRLGSVTAGVRSYLCVAGGFDLTPVLGSLSEDLFGKIGPLGRPLQAGDWLPTGLPLHPPANLAGRAVPKDSIPEFTGEAVIRTVRGPHADLLGDEAVAAFFRGEYRVGAQSDRQGLRLEGTPIKHAASGILSEPIAAGSIQLPPNGLPILLMGNRQTTGGYAEVGVAVYSDLSAAAQLRPGDRIRFQEVDLAEAHSAVRAERRRLVQVRRYLEREIDWQATPGDLTGGATHSAPAAATPAHSVPAAIRVRTLRIKIGAVEYEALVEELPE